MAQMVLKLDLAAVASVAAAALWFEYGHRVVIEPATPAELASYASVAACPETENVPYSARCLAFLKGSADTDSAETDTAWRITTAPPVSRKSADPRATAAACPDTENMPYSANCLEFMSGWLWRADE
jgi:hypothetical protein